jgi:hypothetical protein
MSMGSIFILEKCYFVVCLACCRLVGLKAFFMYFWKENQWDYKNVKERNRLNIFDHFPCSFQDSRTIMLEKGDVGLLGKGNPVSWLFWISMAQNSR